MTRLLILVALLSCAASGACISAGSAAPPANAPLTVVAVDKFTAVIVPAGLYREGAWTPSEEQVLEAEPKIQACILVQRYDLRRTLSRYIRQYWGDTHEGKPVLYVTFWDSRSHSLERLKNHALIAVDSTRDDHFSIDYDQESGKCTVNRFD